MKLNMLYNLTDIISRQAKINPNSIAICTGKENIAYEELDNLIWKASSYFYNSQIRKGEVVLFLIDDELLLMIAIMATARIGATAFTAQINTPELLLDETVKKINATKIISSAAYFLNSINLVINIEDIRTYSNSIDFTIKDALPKAPWLFINGSGSTGKSKIIPVSHNQQLVRTYASKSWLPINVQDKVSSLVHINHYVSKMLYCEAFYSGASIILLDARQKASIPSIEKMKITILHATVFYIQHMLESQHKNAKVALKQLKVLLVGGSYVSDSLREQIRKLLTKNLVVRYGANEIGSISVTSSANDNQALGTIGKPIKNTTIEIVDSNLQLLADETVGRIRIKSSGMVNGYLNDKDSSNKAFIDGYFYPGDLGKFTKDGEIVYYGRSDHMMIMNGINIYPAEIEAIILQHPDVTDTAAMPISHPIHQDIPVCAVVVRDKSTISKKALMDFAYQRLGSRSPREMVIVDAIPRNENGKLLRNELSQQIDQQLASQKNRAKMPIVEPKQFTRMYTINFVVPSVIDFSHLDKWLKLLEIDNIAFSQTFKTQNHALLWRVMVLIKTLLQYSNIPAFYTGEIVKLSSNPSDATKLTAVIRIAHIEYIPQLCYTMALDGAFQTIMWMHNNPITTENTAQLYKNMHLKIINAITKNVPYGQSTIPLLREAYLHNIPYFHLGRGVYQLGLGAKSRKIDRSTTDGDSAMGSKLSHNKAISAQIIHMAGLPSPQHGIAKTLAEALKITDRLGWPLVVKPSDLDRGEGVRVNIESNLALEDAFNVARKLSKNKQVIVERQVEGVCHRLFVAQGRLLYGVKRLPKSLQADGIHTIDQLITLENEAEDKKAPWKRKEPFPRDADTIQVLKKAGYSLESIPKSGEWIALRDIESTRWGGRDEEVTNQIHPDNIAIALRAASVFELDVAGVDIISSDIAIPWHKNGAIITEINFSPLLGGGEISKSHIPALLHTLMRGNGRIPIEAFVGDDRAMDAALQRQKELIDRSIKCFVTSDTETFNEQQLPMLFPDTGLNYRAKALIYNKQVEVLLVVIGTDEILFNEFILGALDSLKIYSDSVTSINAPYSKVSTHYFKGLRVL